MSGPIFAEDAIHLAGRLLLRVPGVELTRDLVVWLLNKVWTLIVRDPALIVAGSFFLGGLTLALTGIRVGPENFLGSLWAEAAAIFIEVGLVFGLLDRITRNRARAEKELLLRPGRTEVRMRSLELLKACLDTVRTWSKLTRPDDRRHPLAADFEFLSQYQAGLKSALASNRVFAAMDPMYLPVSTAAHYALTFSRALTQHMAKLDSISFGPGILQDNPTIFSMIKTLEDGTELQAWRYLQLEYEELRSELVANA